MNVYHLSELSLADAAEMGAALGDDEAVLRAEIAAKVSQLFLFEDMPGRYLAIVRAEGKQLVLAALAGSGGGAEKVTDYVYGLAAGGSFDSIRFHTKRPALARLFNKYNPKMEEFIFQIGISDGRR